MTATEPEDAPLLSDDRIAVIIDALVSAYGEDAEMVARRQLEVADHVSRADWLAILACLHRR